MKDFVLAQQRNRVAALKKLHEMSGGRAGGRVVSMKLLWESANLPDVEGADAVEYLRRERLIALVDGPDKVALTHEGLVEAEAIILGRGTPHFELTVVQTFNGPVGAVQTGDGATAKVSS